MKLRDVIDLEVQLALDEGQDDATLRARDRALYLGLATPPSSAEGLVSAWLSALRERYGGPQVGERAALAQRIVSYLLLVSGLAMGWGSAEALLHYEQGGAPVNVGYFVLVLVFGQLATLLLLLLGLVLHHFEVELPLLGDTVRLLRFLTSRLTERLSKAHPEAAQRLQSEQASYLRVRTRRGLYRAIERSLLLSSTQLFAVAFNLGVLASCLRLILFSDLAFSWSTSLASLEASDVARICKALSWPFAWLVPEAVPSPSLIEHTQYFRLEGRFAHAAEGTRGDAALVAGWWRFLIACTISYGLVPRLIAGLAFFTRLRAAERNVPLDTPAVQRVLMRLTTPEVTTRPADLRKEGAEPAKRAHTAATEPTSAGTLLLLYRDIPTAPELLARSVADKLAIEVTDVQQAGSLDVSQAQRVCDRLAREQLSATVVAEAWEAPDKSLRGFLAKLRAAMGPRRTLHVLLIGEAARDGFKAATPEDVRLYRDRLTLLEDPYLALETLPATTVEAGVSA